MPCTRQIASMLAVLPPPTNTRSWSSTNASSSSGGHGKNSSRRTSALPCEAVVRAQRGGRILGPRSSYVEQARPLATGEPDEEIRQAVAEEPAPDRDDVPVVLRELWFFRCLSSASSEVKQQGAVERCATVNEERYVYDFDEEAPGRP